MFKVKYVDSIMMLVRLDLNLIVSLFQHKCEVSETVSDCNTDDQWCCNMIVINAMKQIVNQMTRVEFYTQS